MREINHKSVLVIGLGASGKAACWLLLTRGARVTAVDSADTATLRREAEELRALGVSVQLGVSLLSQVNFDLAVLSPGVARELPLVQNVIVSGVPLIGELELGYQHAICLNVSITGTNGKTTTTELVAQMLKHCGRETLAAGNIGTPLCEVVEHTKRLDFLTLEVSSFQLETIQYFRPAVAVLLNLTPDHLDRYEGMADYIRAKARLFENQQAFDWAIIQSEALAQMRSLGLDVPSKLLTFSSNNRRADIYLDRSLIISRVPGWEGVLLDLETTQLRGPHNAENLMVALAVGRVLRLPLEQVVESLRAYAPAAHRCELVAEINGVKFINDSKATNLDAVHKALLAIPAVKPNEPNIFLIAGGKDKGCDFHDLGPTLAQRVRHAFLLGETREKIRAAWSLFTPCTLVGSLLEAVTEAAKSASPGDVILLSPACSSFDMFQNYQHRGEVFRHVVQAQMRTTGGVASEAATSGWMPVSTLADRTNHQEAELAVN